MKRLLFQLSFLFFLGVNFLQGQEVQLEGKVTSADDGAALPGVSVVVVGTTIGAVTDFEGNYSIIVPGESATLMFSYVGMLTREIALEGEPVLDVVLESTSLELDEVVVTALGVSREKKSLGYSIQEVDGSTVSGTAQSNFASALSGKVSGVQIKPSNTMGGSVNILIRGSTSLNNYLENQPLFVLDGVPVNNMNLTAWYTSAGGGGYDYGNMAQDLNPNDIESISILKGAAASALYGSRAANGVILVTTKKGNTRKGIGVSVSSNFMVGKIDKSTLPQHQYEYGGGYGPFYEDPTGNFFYGDVDGDGTNDLIVPTSEDASWGARFDPNLMVVHWDALDPDAANYGEKRPWMPPSEENRMPSFFETSTKWVNTVAFDGGNKHGRFRLSYTNYNENSILPNSEFKKNTVNFSGNYNFSKKLSVSANVTYIHQKATGRMGTGYGGRNVMLSFGQWFQTNVDFARLEEYESPTGLHRTWNYTYWDDLRPIYFDNPYWVRYKNYQDDYRDRVLGYVTADYKFTDWLTLTLRSALDTYYNPATERIAIGSAGTNWGDTSWYFYSDDSWLESNTDLMLNFNKGFGEWSLTGLVGAHHMHSQFQRFASYTVGGLVVPELYITSNSVSPIGVIDELVIGGEQSVYGNLSLGYGGFVYIEGTARMDKSSTLPEENNTYLYPSISGTLLLHEIGGMKDVNWIKYLKLRANYAKVGAATQPYTTISTYEQHTSWGNLARFSMNDNLQNSNLRPEFTKSIEVGLEAYFLESRIGLDLALYKTNSFDQIFSVPVSRASGYSSMWVNGGEMENKGFEVALNLVPVKTNEFTWNLDVNWFTNENTVISLAEGVLSLQLMSGGVKITAAKGEPYGTIKGSDYVWSNGKKTVHDNGYLMIGDDPLAILGNIQPDWNMGVGNRFNWKGLSLYALVDFQQGGDIYSVSSRFGLDTGVYAETVGNNPKGNPMRDPVDEGGGNFYEDAVFEDGTPNDVYVPATRYGQYWSYARSPDARYVFDASYVKLRELSLGYSLPTTVLDNSFIRGVDISLVSRNLWIISKNVKHFDPEYIITSGNQQGIEQGAYPAVRTFGVNVEFKF